MGKYVKAVVAKREQERAADVIPLYTRDEMNLVELPFGPISSPEQKTMEVSHLVWDPVLKREVSRKTTIIGSDKYGLPRPIDDQVLVGMSALTYESHYSSRRVEFSRYELCRILNWKPDGRAYRRLEESFYRIAGTTLQFRDAWWDKGEAEWKSKTFHLIDEVDLCSQDQLQRTRIRTGAKRQRLCSFEWSKTVFKSFEDGFIKSLDMEMFRRIAKGRRRDVPIRLYRILDKRFYKKRVVRLGAEALGVGIIGLSPRYSPSQLIRILKRASDCLIDCGYLAAVRVEENQGKYFLWFEKRSKQKRSCSNVKRALASSANMRTASVPGPNPHTTWVQQQAPDEMSAMEDEALAVEFGSALERGFVRSCRERGEKITESGALRHQYLKRYSEHVTTSAVAKVAV